MPNGNKSQQSYISKRREQKRNESSKESPKSTRIVGENINLSLNKKIYDNNAYDILNRDFSELIKAEKTISIEKLFDIYSDIFYSIPKTGNLSHESIIIQSEDFYFNFVDPRDHIIDNLLLEIERQEQVLEDLQTPSPTVSLFPEGTFLKQEGSSTVYIIHGGTKRAINNPVILETAKQARGEKDVANEELAKLTDPETLNEIPSGPPLDTPEDFSIPLKQFDEPEEQTMTELVDLVDIYEFRLKNTQGSILIEHRALTEPGLSPINGTKFTTLTWNGDDEDTHIATIPALKEGHATQPFGKPFIAIRNNTDDPIDEILDITNEDGIKVSAHDISLVTTNAPFIPMQLEHGSGNHSTGIENPDLYPGHFRGKKVETRLITPESHRPYPDNEDIRTIFAEPVSDYYKWEMDVPRHGAGSPNNPYTGYSDGTATYYYGLWNWARVYGRPIYNFYINDENIRWYWTKISSVNIPTKDDRLDYYLELSKPNFTKIKTSVSFELMPNGNYKFFGTNTYDQQLIEVRTYMGSHSNFINPMKVYNPKVDRYSVWGNNLIKRAGNNYWSMYDDLTNTRKSRFIRQELVYSGFEANPYSDARAAMVGPYDFV